MTNRPGRIINYTWKVGNTAEKRINYTWKLGISERSEIQPNFHV